MLVDWLKRYDRKERNWLIRDALGSPPLSDAFRQKLRTALSDRGYDLRIPANAWWAIDFHLDWLIAALSSRGDTGAIYENDGSIRGSQEDIDLIIAFENIAILVEAKGTGSWSNSQLESKLKRIGALRTVGEGQLALAGDAKLLFVLASPGEPKKLGEHPGWNTGGAKFPWFRLSKDDDLQLIRVVRCNASGRPAKDGTHWRHK